jgi:GxxExxY protein
MIGHRGTETPRTARKVIIGETREDALTARIIQCAIAVHRELGPGLLESIYESAMAIEMENVGLKFERQVIVPVLYREQLIGDHRIDLVVDNSVIVELKTVERFDRVFEAQILIYLKLTKLKTGLLINFNSRLVTEGIRRFSL